jgi:hypothetical protein
LEDHGLESVEWLVKRAEKILANLVDAGEVKVTMDWIPREYQLW